MAKLAYVRVSTEEQNEARQLEALQGSEIDKWYTEKITAKDTNRPKLQEMLDYCRDGDTIYVKDFSRLARSTKDLLDMVEFLRQKGVGLVSLKENIDTSTPTGKLMLTMIGAIYQFERDNMLERQREGIVIAKTNGVYKGRKRIDRPENWDAVMERYNKRELSATAAMKELGLKRNTFYNLLKK